MSDLLVKARVDLDPAKANAQLGNLLRNAQATARGISSAVQRVAGVGIPGLGTGLSIGAGFQAAQAAARSGLADIISEDFGGYAHKLSRMLFGDIAPEASGRAAARQVVSDAFASQVGRLGYIPPQAHRMFEQIASMKTDMEKGRRLIGEQLGRDDSLLGQLIDRVLEKVGTQIAKGFDTLAQSLNPLRMFGN